MKSSSSEEQIKSFRLVKYFTVISLIVIFLGTVALSFLNIRLAKNLHLKKSEDFALLLVENLNHQVFLQFVIPIALKFGKIQLRNKEQFERMDKVVRSTLHSFKVDHINIYDMTNTISYSFNREMVGKQGSGGVEYQNALTGTTSSKLVEKGNFLQVLLGIPEESRMITFAPVRAEKPLSTISGPVLGVVEITQNLSDDYHTIFRFQIRVIITCAMVMTSLFAVLILVVKNGERIILNQTIEQIRLKEQLHQAERLSSLGEMAAKISHEIRNPLGIIRSSAELLKKKMLRFEPTNAIPDIIVEEANRLNKIIADFLEFAKPRSPNLIRCRVEQVLEKNITFIMPSLDNPHVNIQKCYDDNLPSISADPDMLYQAFLNILINAVQAMPDGGTIVMRVRADSQNLSVVIEDEGTGIPEAIIGKIWDPFFTTKEKGTGLGLGIVKNIIELHRGSVHIGNRPEKGVRVRVTLPVRIDADMI